MEIIVILAVLVVLALIFGSKTTHKRVRGRLLSDEVHPFFTFLEGLI